VTRPRVVIAGLGPAGPEHVTLAVHEAIEQIEVQYLRTSRHPSAVVMPGATTFDEIYEESASFADVYLQIADRLVRAASEHGEILYAVPGSPMVLERSVRHLLADDRIDCSVLPSLSFLDIAYSRLGIDPIEAGIRLVDGHEFAVSAAGERGPLLVAHCHAPWVMSDIKLAVESAAGDEDVVILQRLGCPDELITHTTWADLDRTVEVDHLTSIYIPTLHAPVGHELVRFHAITRQLRAECPWDRKQTHASLAKYAIEETYELVDAIGQLGTGDETGAGDDELIDELGDVLLQVVLHAAIAEEQGRFSLADVAAAISEKMIRRHPHVFGDGTAVDEDGVMANWEIIKAAERGNPASGSAGVPISAGVAGSLPSLLFANELQANAAELGFDWDDPAGPLDKVAEELAEVRAAFDDPQHVHEELGDLLFAVVNTARHRRVDPEVALRNASKKFEQRVEAMRRLAAERGIDTRACGLSVLDALWDEVKAAGH
jgi:tetrapyrrole methylase family protein / MazG family protein